MSDDVNEQRRKLILGLPFLPFLQFNLTKQQEQQDLPEGQPLENFTWQRKPPEYDREKAVAFFRKGYGRRAGKLADMAFSVYEKHGRDCYYGPLIFLAQIRQESDFGNPRFMISPVGAAGSAMVMPETAEREPFGLDVVFNPSYYKKARKDYVHGARKQRKNIIAAENVAKNAKKRAFDGIDHNLPSNEMVEEFSRELKKNGGLKALLNYALMKESYNEFLDGIREKYKRYEDELGGMVYHNYRKGDARKMRFWIKEKGKKLFYPHPARKLRPDSELSKTDHRFVDDFVVEGSYKEMQKLIKKYNNVLQALAAYNAGVANVRNDDMIPFIRETVKYISKIYGNYNYFFRSLAPDK